MKKIIIIIILTISFNCKKETVKIDTNHQKNNDSLLLELGKTEKIIQNLKEQLSNNKKKEFDNEDFNRFFYSFITDSSFQKTRIKFPLEYNTYDIDSLRDIYTEIKQSDWKFNSFYFNSASERTQIYDNFNLKFQPTNKRLLHWYGIETGGDSKYFFEGFDGKWFLIKKEDSGI